MKYAWIANNKKRWPVSLSCDLLGVSASGFFEHMHRKGADKPSKPGANMRLSNEALLAQDVQIAGGTRHPSGVRVRTAHDEIARHQG